MIFSAHLSNHTIMGNDNSTPSGGHGGGSMDMGGIDVGGMTNRGPYRGGQGAGDLVGMGVGFGATARGNFVDDFDPNARGLTLLYKDGMVNYRVLNNITTYHSFLAFSFLLFLLNRVKRREGVCLSSYVIIFI